MTYDDFKDLVREMREAQNVYFKDRGYDNLQNARRLEGLVDKALLPQKEMF